MNAVRYYSKSVNTKKIAEAIAEGLGVNAISITDEPALQEKVDVLNSSTAVTPCLHRIIT